MIKTDALTGLLEAHGISESLTFMAEDLRRVANNGGLQLSAEAVRHITKAMDHLALLARRLEKGQAPDMAVEEAQEQAFFSGLASGKILLHPVMTRDLPTGQTGGAA